MEAGSTPTSSASPTSGFIQLQDDWSALGPLPVHERSRPGLLQVVDDDDQGDEEPKRVARST
jgi:hypothetical protein